MLEWILWIPFQENISLAEKDEKYQSWRKLASGSVQIEVVTIEFDSTECMYITQVENINVTVGSHNCVLDFQHDCPPQLNYWYA